MTDIPTAGCNEMRRAPGLAGALAHARLEVIPSPTIVDRHEELPMGATVTVTCSPTRGIEPTLDVSEQLAVRGFTVIPHISARSIENGDHLKSVIDRLATHELRHVFVVGGDATEPRGDFGSALELLEALAGMPHDIKTIGIAAYPDGHPLISQSGLDATLLAKSRWAAYAVTQMCLEPEVITRWLHATRRKGVDLPLYLGIPGVVDRRKLLAIAVRIGVGQSTRFLKKNSSVVATLLRRRRYRPDGLLKHLAPLFEESDSGFAGLHINTFNHLSATEEWRSAALSRGNAHFGMTPRGDSAASSALPTLNQPS